MEAADSVSSSSKVIVQCTDPHGLLDKILPNLESRVPLGNLHWKSPTRPLRSIDKLNVAFTREAKPTDSPNLARRHQIPGLRQTPYVKLYLLRCDDRDIYKDTARKEVKQWLKTQDIPADGKHSKKGQERHDAFEYIIVHVVLPGTPAASQPRTSKHIPVEATDSTDSVNSKSKWPGKSSSTVYDKLRADFSSSSKAPFERVAQVRISDTNTRSPTGLGPSEAEEQWLDLIDKLKTAILQSFDARVSQYEEDIRDRDSQRSLPGWNFCTFFVLKEGLAKGFENVGLIEDALMVYDELDAGLDTVVQEQADQTETDSAGALLPFSQDLKPAIRKALDSLAVVETEPKSTTEVVDLRSLIACEKTSIPLIGGKVDYQQRILTNQVSALDLRLYMYTRRFRLLFRKAKNAAASSKKSPVSGGTLYDTSIIAEICGQASEFISFAARALRRDLYAAWGGQEGLSHQELETQELVIGNLVASWKMSAVLQVLDECQISRVLEDRLVDPRDQQAPENGSAPGEQSTINGAVSRPSSSGQMSASSVADRRQSVIVSLQQSSQPRPEMPRPNSQAKLALWVAEFFATLRATVRESNSNALGKIGSELTGRHHQGRYEHIKNRSIGTQSAILKAVQQSHEFCTQIFKLMTMYAFQCYDLAQQVQASRHMLLQLAQIDFEADKPLQAARWLERTPGLLEIQARTLTDLSILQLYSKCIDKAQQPNEYAQCLIGILKSSATSIGSVMLTKSSINLQDILNDLLNISHQVEGIHLPFDLLFSLSGTANHVEQDTKSAGFSVTLSLTLNLSTKLEGAGEIKLRLAATGPTEPAHILMNGTLPASLSSTPSKIVFSSNIATFGWYEMDRLEITIGGLHIGHDFHQSRYENTTLRRAPTSDFKLMIYPGSGAFSVRATMAPIVDLTRTKKVRLHVKTGDFEVGEVTVRVKPGTGGCRLLLPEARLQNHLDEVGFDAVFENGYSVIKMVRLRRHQVAIIDVPYTLENPTLSVLDVKLEIVNQTPQKTFLSYHSQAIDILLPITVNVQDIFQSGGIFSRFTAGPSANAPVSILDWQLGDHPSYEIVHSTVNSKDNIAFPRMPISWVAQIRRKPNTPNDEGKLELAVQFQPMGSIVLSSVEELFEADLVSSRFKYAVSLFMSHLRGQVPRLWTTQQLEAFALLRQIRMWTFEEMQWEFALAALSKWERAEAAAWLRAWHSNHLQIDLSFSRATIQTLKLLVELPKPALVISTQLAVHRDTAATFAVLGQPITTEVIISCDRSMEETTQIHYELVSQADSWLIGGRKKGSMLVMQGLQGQQRQRTLIIPQKTGHLLLPSIDIRCRKAGGADDGAVVACEIEHRSQAQSVLVVSGTHSTTVAMGPSGAGGDYLVTESRQRQETIR